MASSDDEGCGFLLLLALLFAFIIPSCNKLNHLKEQQDTNTETLQQILNK